jgi:hypothetical protein
MAALKKQRWEDFCIGICNGLEPPQAYENAGFPGTGQRASAFRLLQRPAIVQRIGEIQQQIATRQRTASGELIPVSQIELAIADRDGQVKAKGHRWQLLQQVMEERSAHYSDPENEMVRRLCGARPGEKVNLRKLPGIKTGTVVIEMKLLGKTAVPVLRQDTALLRELSALEGEIAQLMGFLKPLQINVDARQDNRSVTVDNRQQVQIVKMVSTPEDEKGQW